MSLSAHIVWFAAMSVAGWIWESLYCAVTTHRWENRGFLFGPLCPIYGFGGLAVVVAYELSINTGSLYAITWPVVFVVSALGSAVLEYGTSYVLEQAFHARWWDYANVPLNINGRIALPFTFAFGVAGCIGFYLVAGPVVSFMGGTGAAAATPAAAASWPWELAALLIMGTLSADLALTLSALFDLDDKISALQSGFDSVMDGAVCDISAGRSPLPPDFAQGVIDLAASSMRRPTAAALRKIKRFSTDARTVAAERLKGGAGLAKAAAKAAVQAASRDRNRP